MRMWNVDPRFLCNKHLLGEHVEMHMFKGAIEKGRNIEGFIKKGLVNIGSIKNRHDELSEEMIKRGINHSSVMASFKEGETANIVDVGVSIKELQTRCEECNKRIVNIKYGEAVKC